MWNFQNTFVTCKQLFISAFPNFMAVSLTNVWFTIIDNSQFDSQFAYKTIAETVFAKIWH